jgi:hypothetical protein
MNSHTDIYDKLQRDHESVNRLFEQLVSTTTVDSSARQNRLKELQQALRQHCKAEAETFYKTLRQHTDTQTLMQESEQDHKCMETLLNELDPMSVNDAQWQAKLQSLKVSVEQHVHQVEGPVFAKAKTYLTDTQARELGEVFDRIKHRTSAGSIEASAAQHAPETTAQVREMGARVQNEAERLSGEAKAKAQSLLHEQQHAIADQVGGFAQALHQTAQHLQEQHHDAVAQYTGQAAQSLERFSQTLRERDINAIVGQVQDFARRQPAVFIGSAALLGFMAARFLKSSATSQHARSEQTTYGGDRPRPQAPTGSGAPVDPAVASTAGRPTVATPARIDRENTALQGEN